MICTLFTVHLTMRLSDQVENYRILYKVSVVELSRAMNIDPKTYRNKLKANGPGFRDYELQEAFNHLGLVFVLVPVSAVAYPTQGDSIKAGIK